HHPHRRTRSHDHRTHSATFRANSRAYNRIHNRTRREQTMKNIQHGLAILIFALASQLFITPDAAAQNAGQQLTSGERIAMQAQRAAVEAEARQTIEALFSRLCPGRCELVEIKAVMESPRAV